MSARHRAHSPPKPSAPARLGSVLLTIAAVLGALCLVMLILGLALNMSLIMFSTGSMAPTIPAGSVALVREIPGDAIAVGDIVTVDRPGKLPVTHRVIEVLSVTGQSATFQMQGDANADPDISPYTADRVRIVLGSVPRLAHVVVMFQDPRTIGALTLVATALVTWAFWPRNEETAARGRM